MSTCWGYIGPLGKMAPIRGVQAGVPITQTRVVSSFKPIGGVPRTQADPVAVRQWQINLTPWSDPSLVSILRHIAAGTIVNPSFLYTMDAAAVNLIPAAAALPGAIGGLTGPLVGQEPLPLRDGPQTVRVFTRGVASSWSKPFALLPSTEYTLSATQAESSPAGALYQIQLKDTAGSDLALESLVGTATGAGVSRVETHTFITPPNVGYGVVRLASAASGRVSGPRLALGDSDGFWEPGQGTPVVEVSDPAAVLQSTAGGKVRADFSVTISEVQ